MQRVTGFDRDAVLEPHDERAPVDEGVGVCDCDAPSVVVVEGVMVIEGVSVNVDDVLGVTVGESVGLNEDVGVPETVPL